MTQRPAGQLPSIDSDDPLERLEALLRFGADDISLGRPPGEDEERQRRLAELAVESVDPDSEPEPRYRMEDRPEEHARIQALRAGRGQRRAARIARVGRRSAVIAVSGGLFVTMLMPALATLARPDVDPPAAVSSPAPPVSSATPLSTPTPTVTSASGTLVRGTTEDGQPIAVVIPTSGTPFLLTLLAGIVIGMVSNMTTVLAAPLAEWMRRRLGLPASLRD